MEWLNQNIEYWHWIVLGILLIGMEVFAPTFFLLWLGVSAVIVGTLMLLLTLSFNAQLLIWVILSTACIISWFKLIQPQIKNKSLSGMAEEAITGQIGIVIDFNQSSNKGRMKFPAPILGNDEWNIISSEELSNGDRVRVNSVLGNALSVSRA